MDTRREEITCFGCGAEFETVVVTRLHQRRDAMILENEDLMRRLSRIECRECGWAEKRPVAVESFAGS
jgi:uncharacterized Zn finger protein